MDDHDLAITYFRPRRAAQLMHQNRSVRNYNQTKQLNGHWAIKNDDNPSELLQIKLSNDLQPSLNRTWCGPTVQTIITNNKILDDDSK